MLDPAQKRLTESYRWFDLDYKTIRAERQTTTSDILMLVHKDNDDEIVSYSHALGRKFKKLCNVKEPKFELKLRRRRSGADVRVQGMQGLQDRRYELMYPGAYN